MAADHLDGFLVSNLTNIRYLSGFHGSAGVLLAVPAGWSLVVDFRYATAARTVTSGTAIGVEVADSSIDQTVVRALGANGCRRIGFEANWISVARFNRLSEGLQPPGAEAPKLVAMERTIEDERAVKDAGEIVILREAAAMLAGVAVRVPDLARPGRSEREVAAAIDGLIRDAGFERPAFETIVASGPNGALPHARPTSRVLEPDEGVVLDFGGVYSGYCVDLTRTVQLGRAPREWLRMVTAVEEAQAAAIRAVRPGIPASVVDAAARDTLKAHGLGDAFGHGTGHGLGLEVHEEPRIARPTAGQPDTVLQPGMVFTVEPGAYVEGLGGVRIEDDVLVTDAGCDVLTRGGSEVGERERIAEADWNSRTSNGSWSS
jgi:Xaa-Pro aminopeptidase